LVTFTGITTVTIPNDSLIKMVLKSGTNPTGSRDCGPWAVYTEIKAEDGNWYTVDRADGKESFFAEPGIINS
jgi:hypothetical protein